ncbi:MAG: PHP domain-containing protein [Jaaginema sp. PMC 1079.18]|nr:PHP domain-containing protein [Jaaginema sp. PMC 1080.18]MEC4850684.1 PHP domain-containing protein [Jaaginema sp. PMC 1079.18]MEC4864567.1 PHP domain-containing protein [Jaaginema sp. PMC 1078.18]
MVSNTAQALTARLFSPQDTHAIARTWDRLDEKSCPYRYNFHLHTLCSDGQLHPVALMQQALDLGLQGLAITDHHTVSGFAIAQDWLETTQQQNPELPLPQLWTGVEITARLLDADVHILGYAFSPENDELAPYLEGIAPEGAAAQAERVIAAIHQAGGLAVLAHPERYRRPGKKLIRAAVAVGIDGVETYYAYRKTHPWRPTPGITEAVAELASKYDLYSTCGTDSHGLDISVRF